LIKTITLLQAKEGMSTAAFISRYEGVHVPLVNSLLGPFLEYVRDYVDRSAIELPPLLKPLLRQPDFDVVTIIRHESDLALSELGQKLASGDAKDRITRDEEQNFERRKMSMFIVDELAVPEVPFPYQTSSKGLKFVLAGKAASSDWADEAMTLPLRSDLTRFTCNRIFPHGVIDLKHIEGHRARSDIDTILEFEFPDRDHLEAYFGQKRRIEMIEAFFDSSGAEPIMGSMVRTRSS